MATTIRLLQGLVTTTKSHKKGDVVTGWDDTDAVRLFNAGIAEKVPTDLVSVYPGEVSDGVETGSSCDMRYTGLTVNCRQFVGAAGGSSPVLASKVQESDNGSDWTDVAGGGFTNVTGSSNVQILTVTRTKRYLRHWRDITGTSPTFLLCASFEPVSSTL